VTLFQAFLGNVGTCRTNAKGEVQVVRIMRARVPMWYTGAEQLVVALRPGNAGGAKELRHSVSLVGQPERGGAHG
jgi:hypothetical protein